MASSSSRRRCTCSAVGALRLSASGTAGGRTKASSDSRSCCNCDEGRNQWYSVAVSRGTQTHSVVISGHQGSSGVIRQAHLELLLLGRHQRSSVGVIRGHQGSSGELTWSFFFSAGEIGPPPAPTTAPARLLLLLLLPLLPLLPLLVLPLLVLYLPLGVVA
jgi:hypothetical protein